VIERLATLLVAAAVCIGRPTAAQEATAPTRPTPVDSLARPVVDGFRLQPSRAAYRLTVLRRGLPTTVGERVVTIRETMQGDVPAWAIIEVRTVIGSTTVDSVIVARADLRPLHWEGTSGGARLVAAFANDTMYGAIAGPGGRSAIMVGAPRDVILSAGSLEALVTLLPIHTGYTAALRLLVVTPNGGTVVAAQLMALREESIEVPAGRFDCWVVAVRIGAETKTLWVRRDGRGIARTDERMPDVDGALLEQALLSLTTDD
jgi:hypothetical protein